MDDSHYKTDPMTWYAAPSDLWYWAEYWHKGEFVDYVVLDEHSKVVGRGETPKAALLSAQRGQSSRNN